MSEILRGVNKGMHAEKKQVDHKRSLMVQRIKKQNTYIDHVKNMVKVHKTTIKNGNNVI